MGACGQLSRGFWGIVGMLLVGPVPWAFAAPVEMPQSAIESGDEGLVERELAFLGFAGNESLCAWQQTLHRPHGSVVDTASTAIVVQMANHHVLAVYKNGAPKRTSRHGHLVYTRPGQLLAGQPEYRKSMSQASWAHLKQRARFDSIAYQFVNQTVRLLPDDDTRVQVERQSHNHVLHAAAQAHSPLGFAIIARLLDGNLITLGHFRQAAQAGAVGVDVQVFLSHTGRSLAALVHFSGESVPLNEAYQTAMGQTPGSPLADFHIGVRNRTHEVGEDLEDLFKGMHPEGAKAWDEHIGKLF